MVSEILGYEKKGLLENSGSKPEGSRSLFLWETIPFRNKIDKLKNSQIIEL